MISQYSTVIIQLIRGFLRQMRFYAMGKKINRISALRLGKYSLIQFEGKNPNLFLPQKLFIRNFNFIMISGNGKLKIGNNFFMNNSCSINCLFDIEIGENVLFGEGVRLYDHNHQFRDLTIPIREQGYSFGKIKIGNNCWIGSNCVILKGVIIGDNVVIGAGCLIHKSIPSNSIVKNHNNINSTSIVSQ